MTRTEAARSRHPLATLAVAVLGTAPPGRHGPPRCGARADDDEYDNPVSSLRRHLRRPLDHPRQGRLVVRVRHLRPASRGRGTRAPIPIGGRATWSHWTFVGDAFTDGHAAVLGRHADAASGRRTSATSTASTACTTSSPRPPSPPTATTTRSAWRPHRRRPARGPTAARPWSARAAAAGGTATTCGRSTRRGAPTPTAPSGSSTAPTTAASGHRQLNADGTQHVGRRRGRHRQQVRGRVRRAPRRLVVPLRLDGELLRRPDDRVQRAGRPVPRPARALRRPAGRAATPPAPAARRSSTRTATGGSAPATTPSPRTWPVRTGSSTTRSTARPLPRRDRRHQPAADADGPDRLGGRLARGPRRAAPARHPARPVTTGNGVTDAGSLRVLALARQRRHLRQAPVHQVRRVTPWLPPLRRCCSRSGPRPLRLTG